MIRDGAILDVLHQRAVPARTVDESADGYAGGSVSVARFGGGRIAVEVVEDGSARVYLTLAEAHDLLEVLRRAVNRERIAQAVHREPEPVKA